ncbi:MAG: universal stress protein [Hyphomicrobium sp.]|nr:universal stress protein [Hyphomicrobium sp.]
MSARFIGLFKVGIASSMPVGGKLEEKAVLHALIKRNAVDLVVVGTHGRTGVRKELLGSVADKLPMFAMNDREYASR